MQKNINKLMKDQEVLPIQIKFFKNNKRVAETTLDENYKLLIKIEIVDDLIGMMNSKYYKTYLKQGFGTKLNYNIIDDENIKLESSKVLFNKKNLKPAYRYNVYLE